VHINKQEIRRLISSITQEKMDNNRAQFKYLLLKYPVKETGILRDSNDHSKITETVVLQYKTRVT
jgi:hypothetical protein